MMEFDVNEANVVKTMMAHARNMAGRRDHTGIAAAVEIGNVATVTALYRRVAARCAALKSRYADKLKSSFPRKTRRFL